MSWAMSCTGVVGARVTPGRMTDRPRRIGVMGGTFDPIHHGHLVAASEVQASFDLDEVVFVPTGEPWQKSEREVSPAEDRYLMTVIATASNPRFSVSRVDIDRRGPTYTIDTLSDLHARCGPEPSSTSSPVPTRWRRSSPGMTSIEVFELAHFVGCTPARLPTIDDSTLDGLPPDRVTIIEVPALAISSTECRARAGASEPVWYLVPDGVVQYIAKRGLYQAANPPSPTSIQQTQTHRRPSTQTHPTQTHHRQTHHTEEGSTS